MTSASSSMDSGRGLAAARSAEAMLRALGGGEVLLRFATVPQVREANLGFPDPNDARLGLAQTGSQDVAISPVVVRNPSTATSNANKLEMLFAASSIQKQVELRSAGSGEALLQSTIAILHQDRAYHVASVSTDFYGGAPYLYRVTVTE